MRMSRAEMQLQTRERVIEAADALFVERGFHASSVGDIAAAAGYTKGAVYSNFASKEDVFFAVYDRRAQRGVAVYAMQLGLSLERLTQPELVDDQLGVRMGRMFLEEVDGVSVDQAG